MGHHPDAVERVRAYLSERGVADREIDLAVADDTLDLLVLETILLPARRSYTSEEIAAMSGMELGSLQRLWRALGFTNVEVSAPVYGEADLEAMRNLEELYELGVIDFEASIQMARVVGSCMARIADAELVASPTPPGLDSVELAELHIATSGSIMTRVSKLLDYAWRRHFVAAGRRLAFLRAKDADTQAGAEMSVGFVDLVGYTVLSQELEDAALARLVERFDALSHDIVTSLGGRVVKMIGDEAMFVVDDIVKAAEIALTLSEAYADDEMLSDVRVGLASGPVLLREGDYFGRVVNLASRLVNLAKPGTVLVSDEVHAQLAACDESDRFEWRRLQGRPIRDIGRVDMWVLRRRTSERAARPTSKRQDRFWSRPGAESPSRR